MEKHSHPFRQVFFAIPHGFSSSALLGARPLQLRAVWKSRRLHPWIWGLPVLIALLLTATVAYAPTVEARVLAGAAGRMTFRVVDRAGIPLASHSGPYDVRLGYGRLPAMAGKLQHDGFRVVDHAESSALQRFVLKLGLPPIYHEKPQAGLRLFDAHGQLMYQSLTPRHIYPDYAAIPQLIVDSLVFAEDRDILDASKIYENPTLEWGRLARAVVDYSVHQVDRKHPVSGGSTLATQLEKLRHSPLGRTASPAGKLRQMVAASLRSYQNGPNNLAARKQIVCDYINSLPLASLPDRGEVIGLEDGLEAWFGADPAQVNRLLALSGEAAASTGRTAQQARAYRQALTLLLAAKKPSAYLISDSNALARRVDAYLRALAANGVISVSLRDAALKVRPVFARLPTRQSPAGAGERKAVDSVRYAMLPLLGVRQLYDLDGLDLAIGTTLDQNATEAVSRRLRSLTEATPATEPRVFGEHLLNPGATNGVVYSFTMYERRAGRNVLRVHTDSYNQPLDINRGTKLELGSTAKLRTLACYLELVAGLNAKLASKSAAELAAIRPDPQDPISAWAVGYMASATDRSLAPMLQAAIDRKYSANPGEAFFTGGGVHHFDNFESSDNGRILTVREAFERSVNLVFIRLMRDIVHYYMFQNPDARAVLESDEASPLRHRYIARFADLEGQEYLERFYRKYQNQPQSALSTLLAGHTLTPVRLAVMYRYVRPQASLEDFRRFAASSPAKVPPDKVEALYQKFGPEKFNLNDQGYLAHVHPLELWLAAYLEQHPGSDLKDILAASAAARQESYSWLFKPTRRRAQDLRIGMVLERDAFRPMHQSWAALGFPFPRLVPSYATAIGSSGDNPEALATLAGIILNGGIRYSALQVESLRFADGTPMEVDLKSAPAPGRRVMPQAVAAVLAQELTGVVQHGTGERARGGVVLDHQRKIPVGGKTGTGDNRIEQFGPHGAVLDSKVRNRTAAFVFTIGDRFFGTVLAYADGPSAKSQHFTSSLAVQVFRELLPSLRPILAAAF